uniref:Neuropeptide Y receptor type 1 n=1 Tax=Lepisosteus oculatus TaxID=7918 RepID=W5MMS3_LEPOC
LLLELKSYFNKMDTENCSRRNISMLSFGEECQAHLPMFFIMAIAYSAVALLGVSGNLALIVVITKQKEMHNVTNILIANLSVSDLLMAVMCLPFTFVYTFMDHWIFGEAMCKLNSMVQCFSISVSIFSLVLIAVERHQLILNPRGWRPNNMHAYIGITIIWVLAILTSLPFMLFSLVTDDPLKLLPHFYEHYVGKVVCVEEWPSRTFRLTYTTCMLIIQYIGPLCFIFICYLKVRYSRTTKLINNQLFDKKNNQVSLFHRPSRELCKEAPVIYFSLSFKAQSICIASYNQSYSRQAICFLNTKRLHVTDFYRFLLKEGVLVIRASIKLSHEFQHSTLNCITCFLNIYVRLKRRNNMMDKMRENKYRSSETKRINVMLFSIVVAFAICWLPLNIFNAVIDWNHEIIMNCNHNPLFSLCHLTAMVSVCVNPIFYGFLNRNFQRDLNVFFRFCKLTSKDEDYETIAMSTMHTDVSKTSLRLGSPEI